MISKERVTFNGNKLVTEIPMDRHDKHTLMDVIKYEEKDISRLKKFVVSSRI